MTKELFVEKKKNARAVVKNVTSNSSDVIRIGLCQDDVVDEEALVPLLSPRTALTMLGRGHCVGKGCLVFDT